MPTFPESARRILVLARDVTCAPKDLVQTINRDPVVTVKFLRVMNSADYGLVKTNHLGRPCGGFFKLRHHQEPGAGAAIGTAPGRLSLCGQGGFGRAGRLAARNAVIFKYLRTSRLSPRVR